MQGVCAMDHGLRAKNRSYRVFERAKTPCGRGRPIGGVTRWRERFQGAGCRLYAERLPPRFVGGLSQAMKGWASAWTADCGHVLRNAE